MIKGGARSAIRLVEISQAFESAQEGRGAALFALLISRLVSACSLSRIAASLLREHFAMFPSLDQKIASLLCLHFVCRQSSSSSSSSCAECVGRKWPDHSLLGVAIAEIEKLIKRHRLAESL